MKLYKIQFNKCDYDMYDSFIVLARNENEVVELVKNKEADLDGGYTIEEINIDKKSRILLGSFNAG